MKAKVGKPVELKIVRDGQEQSLKGVVPSDAILGFNVNPDQTIKTFTIHYSLMESLPMGAKKAFTVITDNAKGFGKIFKGEIRADKALSGACRYCPVVRY